MNTNEDKDRTEREVTCVGDINLTTRIMNCIREGWKITEESPISEITGRTMDEFLELRGFSWTSEQQLLEALEQAGLELRK